MGQVCSSSEDLQAKEEKHLKAREELLKAREEKFLASEREATGAGISSNAPPTAAEILWAKMIAQSPSFYVINNRYDRYRR